VRFSRGKRDAALKLAGTGEIERKLGVLSCSTMLSSIALQQIKSCSLEEFPNPPFA
jgi:hypothetical protein